jgi:hypothetical protein
MWPQRSTIYLERPIRRPVIKDRRRRVPRRRGLIHKRIHPAVTIPRNLVTGLLNPPAVRPAEHQVRHAIRVVKVRTAELPVWMHLADKAAGDGVGWVRGVCGARDVVDFAPAAGAEALGAGVVDGRRDDHVAGEVVWDDLDVAGAPIAGERVPGFLHCGHGGDGGLTER